MTEPAGRAYYVARQAEILAQYDTHAAAWRPFLSERFGGKWTDALLGETRDRYLTLIPQIPYIGGDGNPMTRHLVRSTTSLVLYLAMRARGKTAEQAGHVIYQAVEAQVRQLPPRPCLELTAALIAEQRELARRSQERRYPGDWVYEFVLGDGGDFDYGIDFLECATLKLYLAYGAGEFLPYYCYLDFVTHRTAGWGFSRATTLATGGDRCAFRWKRGGHTTAGWPPPFGSGSGWLCPPQHP